MTDVKLSVVCLAYNHEKYIRQTLEGFVNQKTDFRYEVIIHDDASTDRTADIIREYENKYPDIIRAIYQPKNIYSQGINARTEVITPILKGEYVALCEGDDYWTDNNKLQIQYDYMKAHPECAMCVHQATMHDCVKNTDTNFPELSESREFSIDELIAMGGGSFANNSVFVKKKVYTDIPECLSVKNFGDYQRIINGGLNGTVYYIARNMSTYNLGVGGSWTQRTIFKNDSAVKHCDEVIEMLNTFNKAYDYKYDSAVKKAIIKYEYDKLKYQGKFFKSKKEPYRKHYLEDREKNGVIKVFIRDTCFRFSFLNLIFRKIKERKSS